MTQQLSPQDAFFLSLETENFPAHIGGLAFLEPGEDPAFDYDAFVAFARERIGACERFSWRLQEVPLGLDRPYWVRTPDFDPADHIERIAVPRPYSDESLARLVGLLFEQPLDRGRPLWEITLIEGLPGNRSVLLWKIHHCLMDGASGASLSEQLFDASPEAGHREPPRIDDDARAGAPLTATSWLRRALANAAEVQRSQVRYLGRAVEGLVRRRETEAEEPEQDAPSALAPRAPWNGAVGPHRGVSWSSVPLEDVKHLKDALSVTVNDIVLALTAGALRDYLKARDALPESSLIASVPCSLRAADDKRLGNKVSEMAVRWSTDVEDPVDRVLRIHRDASRAKQHARSGEGFDMMRMLGEALVPGVCRLFMQASAAFSERIPLPGNAVVSNVPFSPFPLYCAGARITRAIPISMLAPTQGMNITVVSYCGELHFGMVHDPELLPDPWELAGGIAKQLAVLQAAVDRRLEQDPEASA